MDFKFRDKYPDRSNFNGFDVRSSVNNNSRNSNDPLAKYSMGNHNILNNSNNAEMKNSANMQKRQKSNIDKYFRSQRAPKNQFKRYMSDVNNVFYEQRESLSNMQFYNNGKWLTGLLWIFLFITYSTLFLIKPIEGKCPSNAKCGVFVNCYNGFQYNTDKNECVLSSELLNQIQTVCDDTIIRIRTQWGNQQCLQTSTSQTQEGMEQFHPLPKFVLNQLLSQIQNEQLLSQLKERMKKYLSDSNRQKQLGFQYHPTTNIIYPTTKLYSNTCKIQLLLRTRYFQLGFPGVLFILCILSIIVIKVRRSIKAKNIYEELKARTLKENNLNVSYAKDELEKVYGKIDEELWNAIDQHRTKDRQIGYFQDDFLYWQTL